MSSYVYETLNKLRLQEPYTGCDVIFQIGAHEYSAHRVVLLARMKYFRETFTEDSTEKGKLTVALDSETIDLTYFSDFLNYVYISQIDFTDENIQAISKIADYFCFDELIKKAQKHMKMKNASHVRTVSKQFFTLMGQGTMNKTPKEEVNSNLSFEHLDFVYENSEENDRLEEMFHYSIDWILENRVNRAGMLFELLNNIPLKSLSFRFLNQIASQYELIKEDSECLKLLFDALITASKTEKKKIEKRIKKTDGIYVIGGLDEECLKSSVSRYHNSTGKWIDTTPMPTPQMHFGCAVIDQKIYVCGGFDTDGQCLNKLTVFDTNSQEWTQLTPMQHERFGCAAAVLNGQMYVAGGKHDSGSGVTELAVVERYDVHTDQWSDVASMNTKRAGLELVAFNGFLYAIGGSDGTDALTIVERYDPQTEQWTRMSNTNHEYFSFGSAVLNGSIYIVGQYTCEVYSLEDDEWTKMPAPSISNKGKRLAVYNGKLYSMRDIEKPPTEWKVTDTVKVFNFQERVWQTEREMNVPKWFHRVAVVERLLSVSIKKVFDEKRSLNELRLQNIGCDVILEIGDCQFSAHRVVLIARMEYFRSMISVHTRNEKSVISIDSESIDPTIFAEILNYIYTSTITLTNENLRPIYKAAEYFRFHELIYELQEHMEFTMNIENVRVYSPIINEFGVKFLQNLFARFIVKQIFSDINRRSREKWFSTLLFEDLKENLRNLKENGNLEDMFNYSVEWILHDEVNRSEMLLGLLKDIPLEKLSSDFLIEVVSRNVLARKNMECLKLLFDAVIKVSTRRQTPRNILFAIKKTFEESVAEYNSITGKMTATTSMPETGPDFGCAVIGHRIYVCGESDIQGLQNKIWNTQYPIDLSVFDTLTRKWTELTPMELGYARKHFAMAALNEQIYVAGGYTDTILDSSYKVTREVMRYDVQTDRSVETSMETCSFHEKLRGRSQTGCVKWLHLCNRSEHLRQELC